MTFIAVDSYSLTVLPNPGFTIQSQSISETTNSKFTVDGNSVVIQIIATISGILTAAPNTPFTDVHTLNGNTSKLKVDSLSICTFGQSSTLVGSNITLSNVGQSKLEEN